MQEVRMLRHRRAPAVIFTIIIKCTFPTLACVRCALSTGLVYKHYKFYREVHAEESNFSRACSSLFLAARREPPRILLADGRRAVRREVLYIFECPRGAAIRQDIACPSPVLVPFRAEVRRSRISPLPAN